MLISEQPSDEELHMRDEEVVTTDTKNKIHSTLRICRIWLPGLAEPLQCLLALQWYYFPFLFLQFGDSSDKQPLMTAAERFSLSVTTGQQIKLNIGSSQL